MMSGQIHTHADRQAERLALIATPILGAIAAGVGLGFLAHIAGQFFRLSVQWQTGAFLGIPAGLIVGAIGGWLWVQKRRRFREAAAALGFQPAAADVGKRISQQLRPLFSRSVSLSSVMERAAGDVRLVLAIMDRDTSSSTDDSSHTTSQTVAWFESPALELPGFSLAPEGRLMRLAAALCNLPDFDFSDSPEFSNRYHLSGESEAAVRGLFNVDVRDHFATNTGWQVISYQNRLLMFRPRTICRPEDLERFVKEALQVFRLLARSAGSAALDDDVRSAPPTSDAGQHDDLPTPARKAIELIQQRAARKIMTPDAMQAFLAEPIPRPLTDEMKMRHAPDLFLRIWSTFFVAGGLMFLAIAFGQSAPERYQMGGVALLISSIGAGVMFFATLPGRRAKRLLRHGTLTRGVIQDVRETVFVMGNQRRYQATVAFSPDAQSMTAYCNLYGGDASKAQQLAAASTPVNVLYDADDPQRILLPDLMCGDASGT